MMNQYPGFVPMMVPPPYMMAVSVAPGVPPPPPPGPQALIPGAPGPNPALIPTPPSIPSPSASLSALQPTRKRSYEDTRRIDRGQKWQGDSDSGLDEPHVDDTLTALDFYNSDLNIVLDPDCYGASVLTDPEGFCFCWAGVRATYGVTKGKVFYEVHVTEHLSVDFGDDHQEQDPHVIRVGWSIDKSSFQLGEEPNSYGYGGTGKFSTNCKFSNYGDRFGCGDVLGVLLDMESRPPTISYSKNGRWFGVAAPLHGHPVGKEDMALFPHILSKNCRFKVNFGQEAPWFPPPPGFVYVDHIPLMEKVRGLRSPATKADCEMIMLIGLPGCGKTTWALNMYKQHPEKRYYVIGTDSLIDKMRVMGLPRKRYFHGRWDVLIKKATGCLNKMFQIASKRRRNIILDQTNVYSSARKRKMRNFQGYIRKGVVLITEDAELMRRSCKRTAEDGKIVPEEAILEMKTNFSLPEENSGVFDKIEYFELQREEAIKIVEQYNEEGKNKRSSRDKVFKHDARQDQSPQKNSQKQQSQTPPFFSSNSPLQPPPPPPQHQTIKTEKKSDLPTAGAQQVTPPPPPPPSEPERYEGRRSRWGPPSDIITLGEPPEKRVKQDPGSALDFIKQQYGGGEGEEVSQQWQDVHVKQESRSSYDGYSSSSSYTGPQTGDSGSGSFGYQQGHSDWGRDQAAFYGSQSQGYGSASYQGWDSGSGWYSQGNNPTPPSIKQEHGSLPESSQSTYGMSQNTDPAGNADTSKGSFTQSQNWQQGGGYNPRQQASDSGRFCGQQDIPDRGSNQQEIGQHGLYGTGQRQQSGPYSSGQQQQSGPYDSSQQQQQGGSYGSGQQQGSQYGSSQLQQGGQFHTNTQGQFGSYQQGQYGSNQPNQQYGSNLQDQYGSNQQSQYSPNYQWNQGYGQSNQPGFQDPPYPDQDHEASSRDQKIFSTPPPPQGSSSGFGGNQWQQNQQQHRESWMKQEGDYGSKDFTPSIPSDEQEFPRDSSYRGDSQRRSRWSEQPSRFQQEDSTGQRPSYSAGKSESGGQFGFNQQGGKNRESVPRFPNMGQIRGPRSMGGDSKPHGSPGGTQGPGGPRPRFGGPRPGGPRGMGPRGDHSAEFGNGGGGGGGGGGGWNQAGRRSVGPRRPPPRFEGRGGGPRPPRPGGSQRWPRPH